jgi:hypothetical protein
MCIASIRTPAESMRRAACIAATFSPRLEKRMPSVATLATDGDATMQAITTFDERATAQPMPVREAAARRMRATDELDDFRRYNYADGWDSDDAALGWIDEALVSGSKRRLH